MKVEIAMGLRLFLSLVVLWTVPLQAIEGSWPRLQLKPAEVRDLPMTDTANIHVTRDKIIDLTPISATLIRLTALKKGVVFIIEYDAEGKERSRILVEVAAAGDEKPEILRLRGELSDAQKFREERASCRLDSHCRFAMTLDATGQEALAEWWRQRLGPPWRVRVQADGLAIAEEYCSAPDAPRRRDALDKMSLGAVADGDLVHRCGSLPSQHAFVLKGYLLALSAAEAKEWGPALTQQPLGGPQSPSWPGFKAFLDKHSRRLVAAPLLRLSEGVEGQVRSGSEYYLEAKGERTTGSWKSAGLELRSTVWAVSAEEVRLVYHAQIAHAQNAQGTVMESSVLASDVILPLGESRLVGQVETKLASQSEQRLLYLSDIPIIGPLLRLFGDTAGQHILYLWLRLEADDNRRSGLGVALSPPE